MLLTSVSRACLIVGLLSLGMGGCETSQRLDDLFSLYNRGDYGRAYREALRMRHGTTKTQACQVTYIAGLSAYKLKNHANAQRFLSIAAKCADRKLSADALATLGLVKAERGLHSVASRHLLTAAKRLSGQDKANAYYHAALSQQKLGQWAQARTSLLLARSQSAERVFCEHVSEQLKVTGFALQQGAYRNPANARRAADKLAPRLALARLGAARVVTATNRGQPLYLVQVGRYLSLGSASLAMKRLNGLPMAIVPLATAGH